MTTIYNNIVKAAASHKKLLAVLIDPDKMSLDSVELFMGQVNNSIITHVFIGGSTVKNNVTQQLVTQIKKYTHLPLVIFPGDVAQISHEADALLFLSLLSGRNSEYLIGQHIKSVPVLRKSKLEVIPTAYILVESGVKTAVQQVTQTQPLLRSHPESIVNTAKAGEFLGMKLIYLEAGSGAKYAVPLSVLKQVKQDITVPLIVGGGINTIKGLDAAYKNGADMVVIGTAFEKNETFFEALKHYNF